MKQKFITAVNTGDIVSVRLMLSNELMLDPRGKSFDEMLTLSENKLKNLYEIDNGNLYDIPSNDWDEKFLFSLKNDLDANFSKDKLYLYKKVAITVLKEKALFLEQEESMKKSQTSASVKLSDNATRVKSSNDAAKIVIVGGVALTIAGLCLSKIVLTSIGVVSVLGGIALYNKSK